MDPRLPKPSGSKFIQETNLISNTFVKVIRIVEYGLVPAEAVQEQIYKGNKLDFQRFVNFMRVVEHGPVSAKLVRQQVRK